MRRVDLGRGIGGGSQVLSWQVRPTVLIWWKNKEFKEVALFDHLLTLNSYSTLTVTVL